MATFTSRRTRIAIIGGGLSGITLAINLKDQLGIDSFTIYEQMNGTGGTWRDNTYPGCACDIPAHWYSLSTEPNSDWSVKFAPQAEILAYWKRIYEKHQLSHYTSYNSTFQSALWDAEQQLYTITFSRTSDPSSRFTVDAEVLISCIGGFSRPIDAPPSLPGLEDFQGQRCHTSRWSHDMVLEGRTIGIIGNGASATQCFPSLVRQYPTSRIINFCRTPSWFYQRDQRRYTVIEKWAFRYIPLVRKLYRLQLRVLLDMRIVALAKSHSMIRHLVEMRAINLIKSRAPEKYHEYLIPRYPFGCKRVILDPGYLESLHAQNAHLVTEKIERITKNGVLLQSGREERLDVLILATGFDVSAKGFGIDVKGAHGKTLTQQWEEQGGPQAYLGTAVAGFPNFFMVLGPNVATGHASVIESTEIQVQYICKMLQPIIAGKVTSFEVKIDAEDRFQRQIKSQGDQTIRTLCESWYRLPNGKIVAAWPNSMFSFQWQLREPNFEHYLQKGGKTIAGNIALRKRLAWLFRLFLYIYAIDTARRYGIRHLFGKLRKAIHL